MPGTNSKRIPILFDRWYAVLSTALGLFPSSSYVQVSGNETHVRMGWAFRATFARRDIASIEISNRNPVSRGVHGFAGRWLVNGSGRGIVIITLNPAQRCHVLGLPLRLRQLLVSVAEPGALTALLEGPVSGRFAKIQRDAAG
jgi:hypothetical protein